MVFMSLLWNTENFSVWVHHISTLALSAFWKAFAAGAKTILGEMTHKLT